VNFTFQVGVALDAAGGSVELACELLMGGDFGQGQPF
jgi:hypothetical protein